MKQSPPITRRTLMQGAGALAALGLAAPYASWAKQPARAVKRPGPNDRIHVGIIGCGGMGRANLGACADQPDVVVTAACDVWASRRDAVASQFKDTCKTYGDYREMLEQKDPGGVGTSDVTKPAEGLDWEMWLGPAPERPFNPILVTDAYNHGSWMDYSGGWTPGMAPHIIDLPIWALDLGYPIMTSSSGGRFILKDDGDAYDNHEVLWQYPNLTMTWMSSLTNSYGFDLHGEPVPSRRLGIYFHGANGTMYANYGQFTIVPEGDKMKDLVAPPKSIPSSPGHEREWLDCIKSRQQPSCSVFYHTRIDVPIVLSLLSLKLGRSIRFDPATEKIVGDPEAAKMAIPKYRSPWKFPKQYLA